MPDMALKTSSRVIQQSLKNFIVKDPPWEFTEIMHAQRVKTDRGDADRYRRQL